ncbi:MAG TPA: hypothetical protein VFF76_07025 [Holophagaceae bacterium]|jgi:hypothetical protein|nr:hypothetical protein [Holophagaceae bacterium]
MKRFAKWTFGVFLALWVGLWAGLRIVDHRTGNHFYRAMADHLVFKRTRMLCPTGALEDGRGSLLISDVGGALWRRLPSGQMELVAGRALPSWFGRDVMDPPKDGVGDQAVLSDPCLLAVDPHGNAYLEETEFNLDPEKTVSLVCKVTPEGKVQTLVRKPWKEEPGLYLVSGAAAGEDGTLYLALGAESSSLWKLGPDGRFERLAGSSERRGHQDGSLAEARFDWLGGLVMDKQGSLFVGDIRNRVVRKIDPSGEVSTVAGMLGQKGNEDGDRSQGRLTGPTGLCLAADGTLLMADGRQGVLRRIEPSGEIRTLSGSFGKRQPGIFPVQLSEDRLGNLILFSHDPMPFLLLRKPNGEVTPLMDFGKQNVAVF